MKNRLKTTSFWLEISGVIVLLVDTIARIFEIQIYSGYIQDIILTICALLITLGVVTKKDVKDTQNSSTKELLEEVKNNDKE